MSVLSGARALRSKLESILARLKATPTPVPPEYKDERQKRPPNRRKKIPIKGLDDKAQREFIKNLRKQMLERAKRKIDEAEQKVAALKKAKGEATPVIIANWYVSRFGAAAFDRDGPQKARAAYMKYLDAQIKYWEGFARMSPAALAQQMIQFYL